MLIKKKMTRGISLRLWAVTWPSCVRLCDFLQLGKLRPGEVLDIKVRFVFAITQSLPAQNHRHQQSSVSLCFFFLFLYLFVSRTPTTLFGFLYFSAVLPRPKLSWFFKRHVSSSYRPYTDKIMKVQVTKHGN